MKRSDVASVLSIATAVFGLGTWVYACGGSSGSASGTTPDAGLGGDGANVTGPGSDAGSQDAAVLSPSSVLQHHKNAARDGLYVDSAFTTAKAAALSRDMSFDGTIDGHMLGQPLFVADITTGKDAVFVATESNDVYSLDGATGTPNWTKNLGTPVALSTLQCGNGINPYGVSSTPIIDLASRTIYLESFSTPDMGKTQVHYAYALSIDDGSVKPGWPVTIDGTSVPGFVGDLQHDRGALALVGGVLYLPYAGLNGDCGTYHGWIVGINVTTPTQIKGWATPAAKGGGWGTSGVSSDGTNVYFATGNTTGTKNKWGGGEAVLRFTSGPTFSNQPADFFTPVNWYDLDNGDTDLGSSAPIVIDVPGATPSAFLFEAGKEGKAFLIDRANMGGINDGSVVSLQASNGTIKTAFAAYSTASGFYVVLHGDAAGTSCPGPSGEIVALRVSATKPPKLSTAWCADAQGEGSPMVTTTDGHANAIVWAVGSKLFGFDGDTGATVFNGGGAADQMTGLEHWITPMEAKGRIFVAGNSKVYAFK